MSLVIVYILAALLFLLLLISQGFKPKFISRFTGFILLFVAISGVGLYGYGYYTLFGGTFKTVTRTLFSVFCMFLGRNEISAISAAPLLATDGMQILIYTTHLLALYCTASAVIAGIGTNVVRTLNLLLVHRGDLNLIYGVSSNSVDFAEQLVKQGVTVMIDTGGGESFSNRIMHMGALMLSDDAARTPEPALLKKLKLNPGSRHYNIYCLSDNTTNNLRYAASLSGLLEKRGVDPSQTTLTLLTDDPAVGENLQAAGDRFGYGSVQAIHRSELSARMLTITYPPCQTMRFDTDTGRAKEDFECVVIGFGSTGQAVLRSLLMNGQFAGSNFKAHVIALNYQVLAGAFFYRYPALQENYQIDFVDANARSMAAYRLLEESCDNINYVVVCTGDPKENAEIMRDLTNFFTERGRSIPVVQCSETSITRLDTETGLPVVSKLFTTDVMQGSCMDDMAMVLNHQYHLAEGRTAKEDWRDCDYFSRNSCRASADFLDAFLYSTGTTREQAAQDTWQPSDTVMESLGETEHKRWCAFHYCMGYRSMSKEVFDERAARYQAQIEAGEKPLRITRDPYAKLHACLVDWNELEDLAEREAAVTGVKKNYKEMDKDNVRMIPTMLKEVSHE